MIQNVPPGRVLFAWGQSPFAWGQTFLLPACLCCVPFRLQAEIPIQVVFPAIFATMIYLLVGFALEAKPYFLFVLFVVLTSNAAISLG